MRKFLKAKKRLKARKIEVFILLVLVFEFTFPHHAVASPEVQSVALPAVFYKQAQPDERVYIVVNEDGSKEFSDDTAQPVTVEESGTIGQLAPAVKVYNIKNTYNVPVTAYSSTVDQTDASPCITASGYNVCEANEENIIAANFLPIGTKVQMPELFGDRIFTVEDRMNKRYHYKADVWMKSREAAIKFGVKYTQLVVLE